MKIFTLTLLFGAVTTQMEGCEKVRLFERIHDMYVNWHNYDLFTQAVLIFWTLGLCILFILIGRYLTTTNKNSK